MTRKGEPRGGRRIDGSGGFPGPDDGRAIPARALAEAPPARSRRVPRVRRSPFARARCSPSRARPTPSREWCGGRASPLDRAARALLPRRALRGARARTGPSSSRTPTISATAAAALLARFAFVPHARVDDLMVSYAVPGGTVGPARRFLRRLPPPGPGQATLAGLAQPRPRLRPRAGPEDPRALRARGGVGARARRHALPAARRRALRDRRDRVPHLVGGLPRPVRCGARRRLPRLPRRAPRPRRDATATRARARRAGRASIPAGLVAHVARTLERIRWRPRDALEFAGPLPVGAQGARVLHAARAAPRRARASTRPPRRRGLALDRRARLLYARGMFFLNGEAVVAPRRLRGVVAPLADSRTLAPMAGAPSAFRELAHEWHSRGVLHLGEGEATMSMLDKPEPQAGLPAAHGDGGIEGGHRRGDRGRAEDAVASSTTRLAQPRLRRRRRASRSCATSCSPDARTACGSRCTSPRTSSATSRGSSRCCASSPAPSRSTARSGRRATRPTPSWWPTTTASGTCSTTTSRAPLLHCTLRPDAAPIRATASRRSGNCPSPPSAHPPSAFEAIRDFSVRGLSNGRRRWYDFALASGHGGGLLRCSIRRRPAHEPNSIDTQPPRIRQK